MSELNTEEIEMGVIGSLILDYETAEGELHEFDLQPAMFTTAIGRKLFEAIKSLEKDRQPIDALTVNERASDDSGTVAPWIQKAIDVTPTAAHAAYYGTLLKQRHESRTLRKILQNGIDLLREEPADIVQTTIMRQLERTDTGTAAEGMTFETATGLAVDTFKQAATQQGGIKTGMPFLDSAGGIQPGELIIISGRAGSCKTTLARQILTHVVGVEDIPSAFITLEMLEDQIAGQTLTDQSKTSYRKFMAGVANAQDWNALLAAKAKAEKWPLALSSRARTPARLSAFVRKCVRRGARLIVLDYLQAMQPDPDQARQNIEQQVTFASGTIRDLAVNLKVSFVVVATENREGDLRYSDAIRYDAWKWFRMIQPEENNEDNPVYHLEVKKHRFGVVPRSVRPLYRVGDRMLTDTEWIEYTKTNKRQRE